MLSGVHKLHPEIQGIFFQKEFECNSQTGNGIGDPRSDILGKRKRTDLKCFPNLHVHFTPTISYCQHNLNCLEVMKLTCCPGATWRDIAWCNAFKKFSCFLFRRCEVFCPIFLIKGVNQSHGNLGKD